MYHPCLGFDVGDTLGVVGSKASVVSRGVGQGPMRDFVVGVCLLPKASVVQCTFERDHNVDFLQNRMMDGYCQVSPNNRFANLDGSHVAKNSEKSLVS